MRPRARLLRVADRAHRRRLAVDQHCFGRTLVAGTLRIQGCLATVDQLEDIPPAERGIVKELVRATWACGRTRPQTVLRIAERVVGEVDGFVTTGPVVVNGVELTPAPGASIVVYTQVNRIVSSNAAMTVGGIALANKPRTSASTRGPRATARSRSATSRACPARSRASAGFRMPVGSDST